MRGMGDAVAGPPGCVHVEPPYLTEDGTCLVGISKWESRQAFLASGITLRPPGEIVEGEIVEGETRPRQRFFLGRHNQVDPGRRPGASGPGLPSLVNQGRLCHRPETRQAR